MKFKHDFITNSSTTAYMIVIPERFSLQKYLTIREKSGHGELNEEIIDRVRKFLIYCERDGSAFLYFEDYELANPVIDFFKELGLFVGNIDLDGPEGFYFLLTSASKVKATEKNFLEKINANQE